MNTRLTINLRDGLLEVDGSEDFVREVYQDFKGQINNAALKPIPMGSLEQIGPLPAPARGDASLQAKPRRNSSSEGGKPKTSEYKPAFKNLNLATLAEFYAKFDPANHSEDTVLCYFSS